MPINLYAGVPVVVLSSIGDIELDMVEEVTITEENLVTQHPTESGAALSDHIVVLPVSIRLVGRFVDFPLPDLFGLGGVGAFAPGAAIVTAAVGVGEALVSGDLQGRSITMWRALEQLRERKELVSVNVQQGTYNNMAIRNLIGPRAQGDGGSQRFQIDMLEIVTAFTVFETTQTDLADDFAHSGNEYQDQGVQSVEDL